MKERNFVIILFLISLLAKIPLSFLALNGFGVDESLYQSLARKFLETGQYGINDGFYDETFVAPLFPLTQSIFMLAFGSYGSILVSALFSSLLVVVVYYLGKDMVSNFVGKLAAIFILLNPALVLLGSRPLTESLGLFLFSLSFLTLYRGMKNEKYLLAFAPTLFLAFVARYPFGALLGIISVLFVVLKNRIKILLNKNFLIGLLIAVAIASPWFLFNFQTTGNIIGGALHQASTDVRFSIQSVASFTKSILPVIGAFSPFVLYGVYVVIRNRKYVLPLILLFALFVLQIALFGKFAEERYLIHILPFSGILMGIGIQNLMKKRYRKKMVAYFFVLFAVTNIVISGFVVNLYSNLPKYAESKKVSLWIKENCSSPVMSNDFTHIWLYSGFDNIPYSSNEVERNEFIKKYNVSCVVVNKFEAPYSDPMKDNENFVNVFSTANTAVYKIV